jgi:hypothetical protein
MRLRVVRGALDPARHLNFADAHFAAMLVARLGAVFQVLQQLVGIPVLGVVIFDVAGRLVIHRHEPARLLGFREDQADETLVGLIAEHVHDGGAFLRRHESVAGRQRELSLIFERDGVRPVNHGRTRSCPNGFAGVGLAFRLRVLRERDRRERGDENCRASRSRAHPWAPQHDYSPVSVRGGRRTMSQRAGRRQSPDDFRIRHCEPAHNPP